MQAAVKQIEISGKHYPVRYDVNALCDYEEITGREIWDKKLGLKEIRALVYVGLKAGHAFEQRPFNLTLTDVGDFISIQDMKKKSGVVGACLEKLNEDLKIGGGDKKSDAPGE